jgi:sortase (surface protein transpeptidase)
MSKVSAGLAALALELGAVLLVLGVWPASPPYVRAAPTASPTAAAAAPTQSPLASAPASASAVASPTPTPTPPIPVGYRIQMPRLAIDLEIREGDLQRDTVLQQTPEHYAFHLPGTGLPGGGTNSYIYAHARTGMFLSLWNTRVGDIVWISTPDGRALKYVVSEVHPRVPPSEVEWAVPTPPDRLTLQTSTGPNPGDPRFVVVALPG